MLMSRTRTRNTIVTSPRPLGTRYCQTVVGTGDSYMYSYKGTNAGITYSNITPSGSYDGKVGRSETITDVVGARDAFNECSHTVTQYGFPLYTLSYQGESTASGKTCRCTSTFQVSAGPTQGEYGIDTYPATWDTDAQALINACNNIKFGITPGPLNLAQFCGELRELKDTVRPFSEWWKMTNLRQWLASDPKGLFGALRTMFSLPVKDSVDLGVNLDLMYKFGVKPMQSDLQKLMDGLEKHYRRAFDRVNAVVPTRLYGAQKDVGEKSYDFTNPSVYTNGWKSTIRFTRLVTAWVLVEYHIPDSLKLGGAECIDSFDALHRQIRNILASYTALGFNKPLRVAWELLPLSFIVDYFINIGKWLDQWDLDLIEIPYTIVQSGHSIKRSAQSSVTTSFETGSAVNKFSNKASGSNVALGDLLKSTYTRKLGGLTFTGLSTPQVQLPSLGQLGTIAELARVFSKAK